MSRDTTVIPFRQPEAIDDPLTEVARDYTTDVTVIMREMGANRRSHRLGGHRVHVPRTPAAAAPPRACPQPKIASQGVDQVGRPCA
jgi:hypothetical protein